MVSREGRLVLGLALLIAVSILGLIGWVTCFASYRMPSDAMMPTLLQGEVFRVNKAAFGLILPGTSTPVLRWGTPQRGDLVVFRHPRDPSETYIKRIVGLPGDHVQIRGAELLINGAAVPSRLTGLYNDGCYQDLQRTRLTLGAHDYDVLACPTPLIHTAVRPETCQRPADGYLCSQDPDAAAEMLIPQSDDTVPKGQYYLVGDNLANSEDSRVYGSVPADHLIGRVTRILSSGDPHRVGPLH